MPSKRNRPPAAAVEWHDGSVGTGAARPARPARRALSSTVAAMLALFLLAVGASAYYAFTMTDEYTGRSLVQFRPRTTTNGGVVSNETAASSAAGYAAYLGVPSTLRTVSTQIAVPLQELRDGMTVQLIPATTSLSITFEDTDPVVAARAASALAQVAAERATDDPLVSATVLAPASVPDLPSSPSKKVVLAAGGVLGLLLAGVAYVVSTGRRRRRPDTVDGLAPISVAPAVAPAAPVAPQVPAPATGPAPAAATGPDQARRDEPADATPDHEHAGPAPQESGATSADDPAQRVLSGR